MVVLPPMSEIPPDRIEAMVRRVNDKTLVDLDLPEAERLVLIRRVLLLAHSFRRCGFSAEFARQHLVREFASMLVADGGPHRGPIQAIGMGMLEAAVDEAYIDAIHDSVRLDPAQSPTQTSPESHQ